MPHRVLRRMLAAAVMILVVTPVSAGPFGSVPDNVAEPRSGVATVAYSIAKITELLETRGYRGIVFTDRILPRYKAEACFGSEKFELKLNWWGDVVNRTKIGNCAGGGSTVTTDANQEIRYILRSKGFSRIRFVNPDPPKIIVEACREGARLRLELDRFGTTKNTEELGDCYAFDEDKTPVNPSLPGVLKLEEVEDILASQGFSDIRFTDKTLPRFVVEACRGGNKFKLTVNRYAEITDRAVIGGCQGADDEDVTGNPPPKRYTRAEIMQKSRLDPDLCQEYFDFLLYDNSVRFDVASAKIRSEFDRPVDTARLGRQSLPGCHHRDLGAHRLRRHAQLQPEALGKARQRRSRFPDEEGRQAVPARHHRFWRGPAARPQYLDEEQG